ncbi:MAG: 2,3-bisphosphoglycerate-independent phosphoglycerate mutase [Methanothrix sp.]|mgnify:CR=1 FL=1|jgi:2,3-bisphosphoglycerate-independent phosphoglycerate mutase|uniref:2,3-bisphosphoglycerate-independent phosphoglycerate mutase n=1 Tax=Methanothrix harundinacea TaxID=301375 RepID=A0A124G301_9EURY|nr:MAG: 2,3-bisphosphoglycerate-independent phosphoglycerate mutase [Methanothrix harundinacea]MCP1393143.1 2,3-bisphosphoglycerate-independent phosphoglycerate mutase [Methanothrix harundinacea]MDD3710438.1 2,3-bisphosphoglycerate-independent phosphoglycerate mutase [Methanothrix sp.]MDI9398360.1 2,3-bisphosphoglycerate-independent phosphoglycerate mutase [Euryarchaeota archaeon]
MKPVTLIIMDGFGESDEIEGNAIASAKTPNIDRLKSSYPFTTIGAAGLDVGLPPGQMGNSEVGHLNLGAGRVVYQDYTRINLAIEDGSFRENPVLIEAMEEAKKRGCGLHLMGLLSDGGVHSHNSHLYALLKLAKERGLERVWIHAILDGRDVPPRSALGYFGELEEEIGSIGVGKVSTVAGRYYSMDRDRRWERTELAYRAMTSGEGFFADSPEEAVRAGYDRGEDDEFLKPTVVDSEGQVRDGDSLIFFNFRPDRARQITKAFVNPDFCEFNEEKINVHFVCMTQYEESIEAPVAFPAEHLKDTLGEVVSRDGLRQLRIAETEKYAHVTFFFNGGREEASPGEEKVLIPSPKVATYDLKPEMSAFEVTEAVVERIKEGIYDLIVLNYANSDMVGHTGIFDAAVRAVEAVDECVGRVVDEVLARGGAVLLTADHGNAEKMEDPSTGQHHTAHTTNPVPFVLIMDGEEVKLRDDGILADVAPTVLDLLGLPIPAAMTGRSLIVRD